MTYADGGILEEVIDYLVTQTYGTKGTDLFYNFIPDSPKNLTSLKELPGTPTKHTAVVDYRFQALVRNNIYQDGREKTKALFDLLHEQSDFLAYSSVSLCVGLNFPADWVRNPETELYEFYMPFKMTVKESFT